MNIVRTLILSALGVGAMAFATPSHADDRVVVKERTYISNGHRYHHRHYWEREPHSRVIVQDNSGVSVAFGGHPRHHHYHYYQRDWDHR